MQCHHVEFYSAFLHVVASVHSVCCVIVLCHRQIVKSITIFALGVYVAHEIANVDLEAPAPA
jgi:hypothetical protein